MPASVGHRRPPPGSQFYIFHGFKVLQRNNGREQSATLVDVSKALVLALLVAASHAYAEDTSYFAVIDRVDLEPASIGGYRLRVYVSALSLQGQVLDLSDPKSVKLLLGRSERRLPFALGTYDATNSDTEMVVLVQATADFADALPSIADALDRELLEKLPDRTKIAVATYTESVRLPKLVPVKSLRGKIALTSDQETTDPPLLRTIDRALAAMRKPALSTSEVDDDARRPKRKIIVVIGDGRDAAVDNELVTRTAMRAGKAGVRIHTLAYSPSDSRRTLLVLGELSKQSRGTLRWPGQGRKPLPETWNDSIRQLATEINKQNVLTYFVAAADAVAGKRLRIVTRGRFEATTDEVAVPGAPSCAGKPCDVGYCANEACIVPTSPSRALAALKWLLTIAGAVIGLAAILGVIGWRMSKRSERGGAQPQPASAQPAGGALPNGRPIPALILLTGPRAGERVMLRNGFSIGKQSGSDLVLEDGFTSSHHAQIVMDSAGNCALHDRGSTNGTFVNGVQIRQYQLTHGVEIKIGSVEMRFLER